MQKKGGLSSGDRSALGNHRETQGAPAAATRPASAGAPAEATGRVGDVSVRSQRALGGPGGAGGFPARRRVLQPRGVNRAPSARKVSPRAGPRRVPGHLGRRASAKPDRGKQVSPPGCLSIPAPESPAGERARGAARGQAPGLHSLPQRADPHPQLRPTPRHARPRPAPAASSPRVDRCSPGGGARTCPRGAPATPRVRAVAPSPAPGAAVSASEGRGVARAGAPADSAGGGERGGKSPSARLPHLRRGPCREGERDVSPGSALRAATWRGVRGAGRRDVPRLCNGRARAVPSRLAPGPPEPCTSASRRGAPCPLRKTFPCTVREHDLEKERRDSLRRVRQGSAVCRPALPISQHGKLRPRRVR